MTNNMQGPMRLLTKPTDRVRDVHSLVNNVLSIVSCYSWFYIHNAKVYYIIEKEIN